MKSKILITGGAGFIGYHLAKRLVGQGNEVVLADNFFRSERDADLLALLEKPNIKLVEADLTNPVSWGGLGTGYDYVYHLVGINGFRQFMERPHEVLRIGISATLNILKWFHSQNNKSGAKILFASTNFPFLRRSRCRW